jgi:hypothetical protein
MGKEFLTSKELSSRWRLSDQTLANWRYARKGPPFTRVGGKVLYPIEGVEKYEQQEMSCAPDNVLSQQAP